MNRIFLACMASVLLAASVGVARAADPAPTGGPGWTGLTQPKAVIAARQELMEHVEILMEPIDTITVKPVKNEDQLRSNAQAIGAMLTALPHLFPPTTNRFDAKAKEPETLALPAIWRIFDTFQKLATSATHAAEAMSEAHGSQELRKASLRLRASCDACHALFLRPYTGPKSQDSDYQFDFESALRKK